MSDLLRLQGLEASCRIGVSEQERAKRQPVWIDLELAIDAAAAAAHDDVRKAVDYAQVAAAVVRRVERRSYRLLETLAEDVAGCVLREFGVRRLTVRAKKRALPGLGSATVEVTRARRAR